jgi:hypothetical protein
VTQWTFPEAQQPVNQFANDAAMAGQAGNAYGQVAEPLCRRAKPSTATGAGS